MNVSKYILLILFVMISDVAGASYFQSTSTWVARCQKPIVDSDKQTGETVKVADQLSACYAYLMAVADALEASRDEVMKSVVPNTTDVEHLDRISYWQNEVCIPMSVDQEGLRLVFLGYTTAHADIKGTSAAYVAAAAFAKMWPCSN